MIVSKLNEHIIIKGNPPNFIVSAFELLAEIMPAHSVKIIYYDTFFEVDFNELYEKVFLYDDFLVVFTMNNHNIHEKGLFGVLSGDCNRLIFYKDIKSIGY